MYYYVHIQLKIVYNLDRQVRGGGDGGVNVFFSNEKLRFIYLHKYRKFEAIPLKMHYLAVDKRIFKM